MKNYRKQIATRIYWQDMLELKIGEGCKLFPRLRRGFGGQVNSLSLVYDFIISHRRSETTEASFRVNPRSMR